MMHYHKEQYENIDKQIRESARGAARTARVAKLILTADRSRIE